MSHAATLRELELERKALDELIKQRINELSQLRTQRNNHAPIFKLPPEVLTYIFHICSYLEPFSIPSPYSMASTPWFKVTHVCKHWREVALNCASLWHYIEFVSPKWTAEMLKRSKNAAIVVKADLTYRTPNFASIVQQALEHVHRIKELDLVAPQQTLCRLAGTLTRPAPHLESLRLSSQRLSAYLDTIYRVPDSLFKSTAPRLRRLELVNCEIDWNSSFLTNLTHLHLDKASANDPGRPMMSQFLKVLSNTPHLQSLRLKHSTPLDPENAAGDIDRVDLMSLSKVVINDRPENTAGLLNRLNMPHDVKLKLDCKATPGTEDGFEQVLAVVKSYRLRDVHDRTHLESLRIMIEYGSLQVIGGSMKETVIPTVAALYPTLPAANPQIDVILTWPGGPKNERTKSILSLVSDSLDLHDVQSLHVYSSEPVPIDSWLATFTKLTSLKSLKMGGYRCSTLIECLGKSTPVGQTQYESARVIFPELRTIAMNDVDFSERLAENMEVDVFSAFRDWLEFRMLRDVPVKEINLANCMSISEHKVAELQQRIVGMVSWDGIDRELSSDDDSFDDFYYAGPYGNPLEWAPEDDDMDMDLNVDDVEAIFGFPF
ncbi:hypothetical protein NEOLEDRAFT_198264 [Neolentinus lepideus HHB14362 ss-1]|uniref:F-box domain-containing protein n=1 Tax=Neolentinus lepideus HHB14362 ss-1 TaxID=1314782 RepID=A0A165TGZ1_9AGAM|nr:hypothetical protein NEOLEDRAFT_198264 [Neolentinus lepideus HHB14362 ss-1]